MIRSSCRRYTRGGLQEFSSLWSPVRFCSVSNGRSTGVEPRWRAARRTAGSRDETSTEGTAEQRRHELQGSKGETPFKASEECRPTGRVHSRWLPARPAAPPPDNQGNDTTANRSGSPGQLRKTPAAPQRPPSGPQLRAAMVHSRVILAFTSRSASQRAASQQAASQQAASQHGLATGVKDASRSVGSFKEMALVRVNSLSHDSDGSDGSSGVLSVSAKMLREGGSKKCNAQKGEKRRKNRLWLCWGFSMTQCKSVSAEAGGRAR